MSITPANVKSADLPALQPTILVAEDHADTREMLHLLLEMWGCRVVEARDGLEAVAAASRERPEMILMDGSDLMAVLEARIDLIQLLLRKRRHASQTGNIYLRIHEIL